MQVTQSAPNSQTPPLFTTTKHYYSQFAGYRLILNSGRPLLNAEGVVAQLGEMEAVFTANHFQTDDPEMQRLLDPNLAAGRLMTAEQYKERTTTPEERLQQTMLENARLMGEANTLKSRLAQLEAKSQK